MFVHLGGDENSKPTYFEVIAADRLVPSLKAAVVYALSVFSQRHPWVHRLLNHDDEVFALIALALDGHSLLTSDSTFADSLYGLLLRPLRPVAQDAPGRLTRRQRWLILICKVILPYLRSKADKAFRRSSAASGGVLALALRYGTGQSSPTSDAGRTSHSGGRGEFEDAGSGLWWRQLERAFLAVYPWLHAVMEGTAFAYQLSYLLGASPVHDPVLHALRVCVARISAKDLMDAEKAKQVRRQTLLQALLTAATAATAGAAAGGGGTAPGPVGLRPVQISYSEPRHHRHLGLRVLLPVRFQLRHAARPLPRFSPACGIRSCTEVVRGGLTVFALVLCIR
ncbi:hypothetical protein Vretimale_6667 [Volvox reticuliferus]|uniref:Pex N-terminal domain-containing protein n=1 Tax=Volvox reticuliferus TaxID=1737510 RepID=A0A8J4LLZ6_9CHLO|nr:hypothetical protein Vretimale_6667 [Volvox reticuliferus]